MFLAGEFCHQQYTTAYLLNVNNSQWASTAKQVVIKLCPCPVSVEICPCPRFPVLRRNENASRCPCECESVEMPMRMRIRRNVHANANANPSKSRCLPSVRAKSVNPEKLLRNVRRNWVNFYAFEKWSFIETNFMNLSQLTNQNIYGFVENWRYYSVFYWSFV